METKASNKPTYDIVSGAEYIDQSTGEKRMSFSRVGGAWKRKEKEGFYLKFNLQNHTGEYFLFLRKEKGSDNNTPF